MSAQYVADTKRMTTSTIQVLFCSKCNHRAMRKKLRKLHYNTAFKNTSLHANGRNLCYECACPAVYETYLAEIESVPYIKNQAKKQGKPSYGFGWTKRAV